MGYATSNNFPFDPSSGVDLNAALSFVAYGVWVNNLTNQWILVRGAFEYVPPYVSGRTIPLQGAQSLDATFAAPPGFTQQPPVPGQRAFLRVTELPLPSGAGLTVAPAQVRWSLNHAPATGVQASVTKAANPGAIHVADFAFFHLVASGGAPVAGANSSASVIDGGTGGTTYLYHGGLIMQAVVGDREQITIGPQMALKGTISNPMTIEFSGGVANCGEQVNLIGYDA